MSATLRSLILIALTIVVACAPPTRSDDDGQRTCATAAECFNGEICVGRRCVEGCVDDSDCDSGVCDRQAGVCDQAPADAGGSADAGDDVDAGEALDAGEPADGGPADVTCTSDEDCELPLACHPETLTCQWCDEVNTCPTGSSCAQGACWPDDGDCVLTVAPTDGALNFGQVRVHAEKVLSATFTNKGSGACAITGARIVGEVGLPGMPDDRPYFTIKNAPTSVLPPGQSATVDVAFKPDSERDYGAGDGIFSLGVALQANTTDAASFDGSLCGGGGFPPTSGAPGCVSWSLSGSGARSDLAALPGDVDFGQVTLGCRSGEQTITIFNTGTADVTITELLLNPAPLSPATFHVATPSLPVSLAGGQKLEMVVRFRPPAAGIHTASLLIKSDATNASITNPYVVVGLRGEGTTMARQTDVFTRSARTRSDVLFVVDDSGSMAEEQSALASNAQRFINVAASFDTDFQIGVVTTDPDNKSGQLRGTPKIISNGANAARDFAATVRALGTNGSGTEKGLQAIVDALTPPNITDPAINGGFLRPDARLAVVVVSDEDDFSSGSVDFYTDFLKTIKGLENQGMVTLSAIVGDTGGCATASAGDRYIAVQQRTKGRFRSICSSDWGEVAEDLAYDVFSDLSSFRLTRAAVSNSITVKVDGQTSPQTAWSFDASANAVVFKAAARPPADATVTIAYDAACL